MTLCHYSDILKIAAELAGLEYSVTVGASGLAADEERLLRTSLNTQLQMLWPRGKWPGLTRVEQRSFRAFWSSGTTYSAPTATAAVEVFDPASEEYYQSLRGSNLNNAPTVSGAENSAYWALCQASYAGADWADATAYAVGDKAVNPANLRVYQCHTAHTSSGSFDTAKFGLLTPFDPYISYTQSGETEIWEQGEILLWDSNPRLSTRAQGIRSFLSENGVQALGTYPARPFVEFKIRVPNLWGEAYSATATYAVNDQVQFETNTGGVAFLNFYKCLTATSAGESPTSASAKWSRVELPDVFKMYLGAKAAVAFLTGENDARLGVAEAAADEAEQSLCDLLYRVQGQVPRTQVIPYPVAA
jgi:hypothetical protein